MTGQQPQVRLLPAHEWPDALDLTARAFHDEPYVRELYGDDPAVRYGRVLQAFRDDAWPPESVVLGAFAGPALLGVVHAFGWGQCHLCTTPAGEEPDDGPARLEWVFDRDRRQAHGTQGEHAWIHRVAVEPFLHGIGLGRLLLTAAVDHCRAAHAGTLLLDCQPHREPFYVSCGFHRATTFPDPVGPDVSVMRIDL